MELELSGLYTQGPTVYAGNIGNNRYVIQVSAHGVRLLEGGEYLFFPLSSLGSHSLLWLLGASLIPGRVLIICLPRVLSLSSVLSTSY